MESMHREENTVHQCASTTHAIGVSRSSREEVASRVVAFQNVVPLDPPLIFLECTKFLCDCEE
jgi:hypothetical protein